MMRAAAFLVAMAVATPAMARPPAYAHKAGVTAEQYTVDGQQCVDDAGKAMRDPGYRAAWAKNPVTESTTAGAAGAALAHGFAAGIESGKRFKLTFYDCHYAKGYTLRRPDDAAWAAAKKLDKTARAALVQQWMAAPEPLHPEAPRDEFD